MALNTPSPSPIQEVSWPDDASLPYLKHKLRHLLGRSLYVQMSLEFRMELLVFTPYFFSSLSDHVVKITIFVP